LFYAQKDLYDRWYHVIKVKTPPLPYSQKIQTGSPALAQLIIRINLQAIFQ
jgi:hypothetical protein